MLSFFFQAEDGIRDLVRSRGLGDVYKRQVPNFNKFRVKLFAGIGVILLLAVGYLFAFIILPKAQVVITTDTSNIEVSLNVTGSVSATKLDTDKLLIPAVKKELSKSETETASATGERDEGTLSLIHISEPTRPY